MNKKKFYTDDDDDEENELLDDEENDFDINDYDEIPDELNFDHFS